MLRSPNRISLCSSSVSKCLTACVLPQHLNYSGPKPLISPNLSRLSSSLPGLLQVHNRSEGLWLQQTYQTQSGLPIYLLLRHDRIRVNVPVEVLHLAHGLVCFSKSKIPHTSNF